ncbi:MAG: hypothetical protein AAFN93_06395 [Bacteroidota bacterium]
MTKLRLKHSDLLQGGYQLAERNILFTFQVNCPGCFLYGIPVFNQLYEKYSSRMSFLGLSTAFEDFDLNTEENTKKLLLDGTIVGETKKALTERGYDQYPKSIDFPVAYDYKESADFINNETVALLCEANPNYKVWPEYDRELMRKNVRNYLRKMPFISHTFTINQFRGTPTFVLFDNDYNIYQEWFGHQTPEETVRLIEEWL